MATDMRTARYVQIFALIATLGLNQTNQLHAQQIVEHAAEQRLQLSFHVSDGALAKFLPYEWTSAIAAEGANKDVNARLVLIERIAVTDRFNRPIGKSSSRQAYLAIPVSGPAGANGQMIYVGLTSSKLEADGNFKGYLIAPQVKVAHASLIEADKIVQEENWNLATESGEIIELHVKFEPQFNPRSPAAETRFYDPKSPATYQNHKVEQVIDIIRNTTLAIDRVSEFSLTVKGGKFDAVFDGKQVLLGVEFIPWASHVMNAP